MKTYLLVLALVSVSCASKSKIIVSGGSNNTAEAKIVVTFPEAALCFEDDRVDTYERLKECLELVTNKTWTVSVDGNLEELSELVKASEGAE